MAFRWLEAFQGARNATILGRLYSASGSLTADITDEYGRSIPSSATLVLTTPALVGAVQNSWILGFGFQITQGSLNSAASSLPFVSLRDSVGEQIRFEIIEANTSKPGGSAYKIRAMRGATELARTVDTFPGNIQDNRRIYFEIKATVRTGTNGSFELRYFTFKGGNTPVTATWDAAATGINTADQGTDGADRMGVSWATGDANDRVAFSDIYACDSTGTKNNDYLGKIYVEALDPQGTGTTNEWVLAGTAASLEDAWNEGATTQTTGEDDKRVTSEFVGDISLATMTNLSTTIANAPILALQARIYAKMDTSGTRTIQMVYRKTTGSPAQVQGATKVLTTTSIVGLAETLEDDPNTAADWVAADIDGIEIGVELDA